jgi:hypothetical protein
MAKVPKTNQISLEYKVILKHNDLNRSKVLWWFLISHNSIARQPQDKQRIFDTLNGYDKNNCKINTLIVSAVDMSNPLSGHFVLFRTDNVSL